MGDRQAKKAEMEARLSAALGRHLPGFRKLGSFARLSEERSFRADWPDRHSQAGFLRLFRPMSISPKSRVYSPGQIYRYVFGRHRGDERCVPSRATADLQAYLTPKQLLRGEAIRQPVPEIVGMVVVRPRPLISEGFLRLALYR